MVRTLFDPRIKKSFTDFVIVLVLSFYVSLYFVLPKSFRIPVYCVLFAFWRLMYNGGIGWLLDQQSKSKRLTKFAEKHQLFKKSDKLWHKILKHDLSSKLDGDYDFYTAPLEYNTWMLFRHFEDLVLMSDFVNYMMLAISCYSPSKQPFLLIASRWIAGLALFFFNLWVKLDAHRVVKDYAWYWGDFFFLEEIELTFDGVFELAPHPMYSIGYAGYYGFCLMTASYTLFFASILAHAAQFAFLILVENPHIEKTYNPPPVPKRKNTMNSEDHKKFRETLLASPGVSSEEVIVDTAQPKRKALLIFSHFQLTRVTDILTILVACYSLTLLAAPQTFFWNFLTLLSAIGWRLFHNFGLGHILSSQSESKGWTRLFLKYGKTPIEAYEQWQVIYNVSTVMSYLSLFVVCIRQREITSNVQYWPFKYIIGCMMIALHTWTSFSIYESLDEYGWFFGDFFFPEKAKPLTYSGIYRYLNNPERLFGISGVWGLSLISGSFSGYLVAFVWTLGGFYFIKFIEQPHMQKLYGSQIRAEAGLTKTIKRAMVPPVENTVQKFQGSIEKVLGDTAKVVESFLGHAKPRIQEGVRDTRVLLTEYPAKLIITKISEDAKINPALYSLKISSEGAQPNGESLEIEYGTPIQVEWTADPGHSVKDWIGLYKLTDNTSSSVTKVPSKGCWSAVDERGFDNHTEGIVSNSTSHGTVEFTADALVWTPGVYQFRYHHDGKHNVLALSHPFTIVATPLTNITSLTAPASLAGQLLPIVQRIFTTSGYIPPISINENWDLEENPELSKRIATAVKEICGVDLAVEVLQGDKSVGQLAVRLTEVRNALEPFVNVNPEDSVKI